MTRPFAIALTALALLLPVLAPGLALAQHTPCPPSIDAWVAEAAAATGTPTEAVSCPVGLARLRLHPEGAAPMDVEVAEPPGPAFRHAGSLRTSPIVEIDDYADLPAPQRASYEALVEWLQSHESSVVLRARAHDVADGAPAVEGIGLADAGWWLVVAALLLVALGLARDRPRTVEWKPAGLVVIAAAALRTGLGVWGPHHVNGQGPLWIRGALEDRSLLGSYGPGYPELLGPVARAFPATPDTAIFVANVVLGSIACGLLFGVARGAGLERSRALFAALLLALAPPAVRFAASEAYFTPIIALVLAATLLTVLASGSLARRRWLAAVALYGAAALMATQAARIHPAAWLPVALVPLAAILPLAKLRNYGPSLILAGGVSLLVGWVTSGAHLVAVLSSVTGGEGPGLGGSVARSGLVGEAAVVLILGAVALVVARPRRPVLVALPQVLLALATWRIYGQSEAWTSSYITLFLPTTAVGLAAILPRDIRPPLAAGLAAAMASAVFLVAGPPLRVRTTEQLEHGFLREELANLDPDCRVAYLERTDRRVVMPPSWAHPGAHRPLRVSDPGDLQTAASRTCLYWLHTSICSSEEGRPLCRAMERSVTLRPVAHARLPARPSYDGLPYDEERVEVAIHEVVGQ